LESGFVNEDCKKLDENNPNVNVFDVGKVHKRVDDLVKFIQLCFEVINITKQEQEFAKYKESEIMLSLADDNVSSLSSSSSSSSLRTPEEWAAQTVCSAENVLLNILNEALVCGLYPYGMYYLLVSKDDRIPIEPLKFKIDNPKEKTWAGILQIISACSFFSTYDIYNYVSITRLHPQPELPKKPELLVVEPSHKVPTMNDLSLIPPSLTLPSLIPPPLISPPLTPPSLTVPSLIPPSYSSCDLIEFCNKRNFDPCVINSQLYTLGEYPAFLHIVELFVSKNIALFQKYIKNGKTFNFIKSDDILFTSALRFPQNVCKDLWNTVDTILATLSFINSLPLLFSFIRLLSIHTSTYLFDPENVSESSSSFSSSPSKHEHCKNLCRALLAYISSSSLFVRNSGVSLLLFLLHLEFSCSTSGRSQVPHVIREMKAQLTNAMSNIGNVGIVKEEVLIIIIE
jgi:hypothetical protein